MKQLLVVMSLVLLCSCLNRMFVSGRNAGTGSNFFISQPAVERGVPGHILQQDIENGLWSIEQLKIAGEKLFLSQFTLADGMGRPGATGNNAPTRRPLGTDVVFARTAGPDANSCFSCHRSPSIGGAGDFTVNVFGGLGARQPVMFSTDPKLSAERGTPELNGSGAIELLAREMTVELHTIREETIAEAKRTRSTVRKKLITKGISYGYVIAEATGTLKLNEVEGIDRDLVVRPWTQKGTVTSLRTFTVNAMNLHHGMQATERFGIRLTGSEDFDRDGVKDELTEGDITAMVIFQASLNIPGQLLPKNELQRKRIAEGEVLFKGSQCATCHLPELVLNNPVFAEPGLYNLEGTLRQKEVKKLVYMDLTKDIAKPMLSRGSQDKIIVKAYSDFKRHRIADSERPYFGNEDMVEGLTSTDEFITRRLWAVGNTAPYGHRGDIMTLREAIHHHGGEARAARIEFDAMSHDDQQKIIEFLKSLQVLPNDSKKVMIDNTNEKPLPYARN